MNQDNDMHYDAMAHQGLNVPKHASKYIPLLADLIIDTAAPCSSSYMWSNLFKLCTFHADQPYDKIRWSKNEVPAPAPPNDPANE